MNKAHYTGIVTLIVLGLFPLTAGAQTVAPGDSASQTEPTVTTNKLPEIRIVDNRLESRVFLADLSPEADTVAEVLTVLGYTVAPEDVVFPALAEAAPFFGMIQIERAPGVSITADGKNLEIKTRAPNVAGLLAEKGITLDDDDRVEPAAESVVVPNMSVRVIRVESKQEKEKEAIAFETTYQDDATRYQGEEAVKTEGKMGEKEKTYKLVLEDGVRVTREIVEEKVLIEPVTKVVLRGTKIKPVPKTPPSTGPATGPHQDLVNAAATKYGVNAQELMRVMLCESNGYQWSVDSSKTYYGLFQYRKSLWEGSWNPYRDSDILSTDQIAATAYAWSIGMRGHWGC
jgi:uncharacterized protein YabE (DUF348 family)